jgi:hypothetical protein
MDNCLHPQRENHDETTVHQRGAGPALVFLVGPRQLYASDGDLDTTFGIAGRVTASFFGRLSSRVPDVHFID